jgi:glucose-6-phosphate 1-dehydrogenase
MAEACRQTTPQADTTGPWQTFAQRLYYASVEKYDADNFTRLQERIKTLHRQHKTEGNTVLYLAVPASGYGLLIEGICASGLCANGNNHGPLTRLVIEKPFGRDLTGAQELDQLLKKGFRENQIFRIDHYLGKETVQNILVFRFGNSLFEPIWNRKYIEYIEITACESIGVQTRGEFYERTGVLRDMVQNHIMQVLTLVAMEQPLNFKANPVRDERVKVLRSLRPIAGALVSEESVRGQYAPGASADGKTLPAYRHEKDVSGDSITPTFAALRVFLDSWRWQGVPFYIRSGKAMKRQLTDVRIHFQRVPVCFFGDRQVCEQIRPNVLTLRIQPDEGISLHFVSKAPGEQMKLADVAMDFNYHEAFGGNPPDAYQRLLLDILRGDATLFSRQDEIEASWQFITPILQAWEVDTPKDFPNYPAGGQGPPSAHTLLQPGHTWTPL